MNNLKLTIELVPSSSWCNNVRTKLKQSEWDKIRRKCYQESNYVCDICGGKGRKHPVECHEIWNYNDKTRIQKLIGLTSLCPSCHEVKHIGLTTIKGREKQAIKHLMKVNNINERTALNIIDSAFMLHGARSTKEWDLDISFLETYI